MPIRWLAEIDADDVDVAGGKGASLGELVEAGLPVPSGFVVTASTFRTFVESAGIGEDLYDLLDVDASDPAELEGVAEEAQSLVTGTPVPDDVATEIREAYARLGTEAGVDDPFVAVRSSATAEDLPDSSFAGQQDTYLNVTGDDLVDRVQQCWASLFTNRAIYYRQTRGFDHEDVDIAVVVQRMVDAEKSGVMFTRDPSTGEEELTVEAAWGLGEGVVSGTVSPDTYVLDPDGTLRSENVATKRTMIVRDEDGETVERDVSAERRDARVLDADEIDRLVSLGATVEDHYGGPQDVEWAIADGEVFLLQSRPITTIDEGATSESDAEGGEELVDGLSASPGTATGAARIVTQLDQLDKVGEGDVIVTEMTTPDMVPAMQRASALVTDEGGLTSHAAIVSRELGVPAVTGTGDATTTLDDGQQITVDGDRGTIETAAGGTEARAESPDVAESTADEATARPPMTATEVKVNVSMPAAAERAADTGADGVGLLRLEHMILETGKTPARYVEEQGEEAYVDQLVAGIRSVADAFYPRPVRVRTLDAPTDEFRHLEGGETEPTEHNPMLGFRGIRRSFQESELFKHELRAFERLYGMGYDNLELMFPLVNDADDVDRAVSLMEEVGIDPERRSWGVMVETPSAALVVDDLIDAGIDFVSMGTNDLTQYTLAVDRNNERVADRYDAEHPAVKRLLADVVATCRENDVTTSICGEAASQPGMVRFLVEEGVTSISANIDAVRDVQQLAKRVEQRLLLDSVR